MPQSPNLWRLRTYQQSLGPLLLCFTSYVTLPNIGISSKFLIYVSKVSYTSITWFSLTNKRLSRLSKPQLVATVISSFPFKIMILPILYFHPQIKKVSKYRKCELINILSLKYYRVAKQPSYSGILLPVSILTYLSPSACHFASACEISSIWNHPRRNYDVISIFRRWRT